MQHVHIVETCISPCEEKFVGRNVRAVLHSFGGRRHLRGGRGVVIFSCPQILPVHFRSKNQNQALLYDDLMEQQLWLT